jgi:predicted nucleic acid-binding protein
MEGVVRNCSVVLAELWRGAFSRIDQEIIKALERSHPIFSPTTGIWLESGQLLSRIRADKGLEAHKLRDLHFDVLIALTVRAHGACLVTSSRADFELIRDYRDFRLEVW